MSVFIYGATGHTGSLISRALGERGIPLVLSGRDPTRLAQVAETLAAELGPGAPEIAVKAVLLHEREALEHACAQARVIVSCAGPFAQMGEPVLEAAIRTGVPYIDIASEQAFLRTVYETYESAARKRPSLVVNGLAAGGALGDWGAAVAAQALHCAMGHPPPEAEGPGHGQRIADEVSICYALNHFGASTATQLAAADALVAPGYIWSGDRWDEIAPLSERRLINFGSQVGQRATLSFPAAEVITVPRHVRTRRVQTYFSLLDTGPFGDWFTRLAPAVVWAMPSTMRAAIVDQLRQRISEAPTHPSATDRNFATFAIACEARRGFERARVLMTGRDPYGLTASLVAWAVEELLERTTLPHGMRTPAEVFSAHKALAAAAELGQFTYESSSSPDSAGV